MILQRNEILKTIRNVMPGVDTGHGQIEGADTFLVRDDTISTYNGTVAVSAPFACEKASFCVKANDFYNLVSKMRGDEVTLEVEDGKVKLSCGKTKASLTQVDSTSIAKYISSIKLPEFKAAPDGLKEAFSLTAIGNIGEADLTGVYVKDTTMIATDRRRISSYTLASSMDEFRLDDKVFASAFVLGDPKEYGIHGPWISFKYENGVVFSAMRMNHSSYPGAKIIPVLDNAMNAEKCPVKASGKLPVGISETISRVSVLADFASGTTSEAVRVSMGTSGVTIFAEKLEGTAEETIDWEATPDIKEDVEFWVNKDFIMEASKKSADFKIISLGNSTAVIFTGPNYSCLVSSCKR